MITYFDWLTDNIGSLFTLIWATAYFLEKNPKEISYKPGATVIILLLFFSHKKLSGQVFNAYTSHGTKFEF